MKEILVIVVTLFIMIAIGEIARLFFNKRSERSKEIPFIIITILMFVFEIAKQIYYLVFYKGGYPGKVLPFYFSSTFPFVYLVTILAKGEFKRKMQGLSAINSMMAMLAFYISPRSMVQDAATNLLADFPTFHTYFYHHLMFMYVILSCFLNVYKPVPKKDIPFFMTFLAAYSLIGISASYILKQNYNNFRPVLEQNLFYSLRNTFGSPVYVIVIASLFTISSYPSLYIYNLFNNLINKGHTALAQRNQTINENE